MLISDQSWPIFTSFYYNSIGFGCKVNLLLAGNGENVINAQPRIHRLQIWRRGHESEAITWQPLPRANSILVPLFECELFTICWSVFYTGCQWWPRHNFGRISFLLSFFFNSPYSLIETVSCFKFLVSRGSTRDRVVFDLVSRRLNMAKLESEVTRSVIWKSCETPFRILMSQVYKFNRNKLYKIRKSLPKPQ